MFVDTEVVYISLVAVVACLCALGVLPDADKAGTKLLLLTNIEVCSVKSCAFLLK